MYRSYSVNDMPQPVTHTAESEKPPEAKPKAVHKKQLFPLSFGKLKTDDIILLLVILMLVLNECDDNLLFIALIFIFFSDFN